MNEPQHKAPRSTIKGGFVQKLLDHKRLSAVLIWAILALCWLPILLAGFPGFFAYDAGVGDLMQWGQIESGQLNAHHAILHTLFLEATIKLGMALGGSFNAGVLLSVCVQAALVAGIFTGALLWSLERGLPTPGFIVSLIYLGLDPIIGMFAFTATKDVFFAALLLVYCLQLYDLAHNRPCSTSFKERLLAGLPMAIVCFLILALRMNALVAMIIIVPLVLLILRRSGQIRTFIISTCVSLLLTFMWLVPISAALNVEKSPVGIWNSLCIPLQQIARASVDPAVSEQDKEYIFEVVPEVEYQPDLSDISRNSIIFQEHGSAKDLAKLYIYLGTKYPGVFFDAALAQTEDAWNPFAVMDCYRLYAPEDSDSTSVFAIDQLPPSERESLFPELLEILRWISTERSFVETPVISLIASIPFYLFVLLACLVYSFIKRKKCALAFLVPLLALSISNLFGPCMLLRYFLYLLFALPFMLFVTLKPERNTASKTDAERL